MGVKYENIKSDALVHRKERDFFGYIELNSWTTIYWIEISWNGLFDQN